MTKSAAQPPSTPRHVVLSIASQFLRLGAPLIYYPILAHSFGSNTFASFATTLALAQIASSVIEFGMGTNAVRCITQKIEKPSAALSSLVYGRSIILLVLTILYIGWISLTPQNGAEPVVVGLTVLMAFGLGFTPVWYYSAKNRIPLLAATEVLTALLQLSGIALFVRGPSDFETALICIAAPPAAHALIAHIAARVEFGPSQPSASAIVKNYRQSANFFQINMVQSNIAPLLILILGATTSAESVAFYALAERIYSAASGLSYPIIRVIFPRVSALVTNDQQMAIDLFQKSTTFYLSASFVGCIPAALTTSITIPILFGSDFSGAWPTVAALLVAAPLAGTSRMIGMIALVSTSSEVLYRQITVVSGLILLAASTPIALLSGSFGLAVAKLVFELAIVGALIAALANKSPLWLKGQG